MMKLSRKNEIKRNLIWIVLLSIAFLIQTSAQSAPHIGKIHLSVVLPLLSCVCMFEKEKSAPWYGLGTGMLLDVVSPGMVGYHALLLLLQCTVIGWFVSNYIRNTLLTNLLMGASLIFLSKSLYWLFFVEFKQTPGAVGIYFTNTFPSIVLSCLLIFPFFFLILTINRRYKAKNEIIG